MAQYKTLKGYQYEGQDLTGLTCHSAVKYMLACIPALREFHGFQDKERKELIVATAVILRQYEEIEDESDPYQPTIEDDNRGVRTQVRVNFLDIINSIIRNSLNEGMFNRLNEQQALLESKVLTQTRYQPILRRQSDKAKGEVFPTIWYGSDLVRKPQDFEVPKTAKYIEKRKRMCVRSSLISMGILLYGDYFTEEWERRALAIVVAKFRDLRAWPLPDALRSFE
ncbi:hypothetical protein N0V95_007185 [Ascochyta clinopodiicola]|nr:hypothetical protein N0V95_007185 [Ascochyta clinopodiicola]